MTKKKKNRQNYEVDYWQSTSDMLISLLLILLLVMLLLGLYILYVPDDLKPGRHADDEAATEYGDEEHREDHMFDNPDKQEEHYEDNDDNGNGNGDGQGEGKDVGPGESPDEGVKTAVHVSLIDAETKKTIKEQGVTFELFSNKNGLQSLNTYYPEKITYRDFQTTEDGTFYLPEKIWPGKYYFHEVTEPTGYDAAADQKFKVKKLYDWPEPYEVQIPVYPSRNIVRIQMNDKDSGIGVGGGSFYVIAAEDIVTLDGTLRYKAGEVAAEVLLNEEGYGESDPIYLGKYYLKQNTIPQYYASVTDRINVEVEKKAATPPEPKEVLTEKTRITIQVSDELNPQEPLEGVKYEINSDGQPSDIYTTDKNGVIELEDIEKNTTYHVKQAQKYNNYLLDEKTYDVPVAADGRIDSKAHATLSLTNRLIRVTISLTDLLLGSQVTDVNLALYDSNDKVIRTWTTTGVEVTMNDLEPGTYQVVKDGDKSDSYLLTVENTAKPQELNISIFTWRSALVIAIAALALIIVIAALKVILSAAMKNKKKNKKYKVKSKKGPKNGPDNMDHMQ